MIDAEGLTKRFGDVVAVDDVTFHVNEGEFFGCIQSRRRVAVNTCKP